MNSKAKIEHILIIENCFPLQAFNLMPFHEKPTTKSKILHTNIQIRLENLY